MSITEIASDKNDAQRDVFQFTLLLAGVPEITNTIERAIFEAGCDDAILGMTDGEAFLAFDREQENLREAIVSAIHQVENCGLGIRVCKVILPGEHFIQIINALLSLREEKKSVADELLRDFLKKAD